MIENGFQGLSGQQMPDIPDDFIEVISERYIELYEKITGNNFSKSDTSDINKRIEVNVEDYLNTHN